MPYGRQECPRIATSDAAANMLFAAQFLDGGLRWYLASERHAVCWYSFWYGDVSPSDSLLGSDLQPRSCKRTNNSSGVPTTPNPMPKSVQINFLKSVYNLKSSENLFFHTWCDGLIYRPDLQSY
jgi:hypothetical protein